MPHAAPRATHTWKTSPPPLESPDPKRRCPSTIFFHEFTSSGRRVRCTGAGHTQGKAEDRRGFWNGPTPCRTRLAREGRKREAALVGVAPMWHGLAKEERDLPISAGRQIGANADRTGFPNTTGHSSESSVSDSIPVGVTTVVFIPQATLSDDRCKRSRRGCSRNLGPRYQSCGSFIPNDLLKSFHEATVFPRNRAFAEVLEHALRAPKKVRSPNHEVIAL